MSDPIRILNVVSIMSPGGIENFVMNVYRNIDRDKIQFDFLTHYGEKGLYDDEIEKMGGKIYQMPQIRDYERAYYHRVFKYRAALIDFFKKHQEYHILHGHMTNTAAIYMPISKKYGNVSCCIAHSHSTKSKGGMIGIMTDILHKPVRRIADNYFACSEEAAKWIFQKEDIESGKVWVVKNGIETNRYKYNQDLRNEIRNKYSIEDKLIIGCVGRFRKEKNQVFLVDVLSEMLKKMPNTRLMLVGDGIYKESVEEKARNKGIREQIIFMGNRNDVNILLQCMDIFVLPSYFEGVPTAAIEAQASGLPCVISDTVKRDVKLTEGVKFLSLDAGSSIWAEEIIKMHNKHTRGDQIEIVNNSGYGIESIAKQLERFYLGLVES